MPNLKLSNNALQILRKRYLKKNDEGKVVEKPEDLFRRVANNIALADAKYILREEMQYLESSLNQEYFDIVNTSEFKNLLRKSPKAKKQIEKTEKEFYNLMASLDFLPNSPTLFNAGRSLQQLAACFVLPVEDNLDSIFKSLHYAAKISKSGSGTGFNFSHLRPKNDVIESVTGFSSGPLSFMKIFDAVTEQIKLGGLRRGALMGILRVDHPDIEEFVTSKSQKKVLENFNISVAVTDRFMEAVRKKKNYDLINPRTQKKVKEESAEKIFNLICEIAHKTGDPGLIFLDRINKDNPMPKLGMLEATDSCGEQPLLPYESANLGSINLSNMIKSGNIDFDKLKNTVNKAIHFLDNVIDMCHYPTPETKEIVYKNRKIGLGVMGFAEMLIKLQIPYNSDKAVKVAEKIISFIREEADNASMDLAKERLAFPSWEDSIYNRKGKAKPMPLRNATRLTIAPTGSISIIADASFGIEPLFALTFTQVLDDGTELLKVDKHFKEALKKMNLYNPDFMKYIAKKGTIQNMESIPKSIRDIFVVSYDISPEYHLKIQAAFQKHIDNAVSKCVHGDSIVFSQFGMLPIKNLGNAKENSFSYNPIKIYSNNSVKVAEQFYNGGLKDTVKIETKYGYNLEGTLNHKVYIMDNSGKIIFKSLSNIKEGDYVAIQQNQNFFGNKISIEPFNFKERTNSKRHKLPKKLNEDLAFFLGCVISEGNLTKKSVKITNCDSKLLNKLLKISKKLFDLEGKIVIDKRNDVTSLLLHSTKLVKFLKHIGVSGTAAYKIIPKCIMQTTKRNIIGFLNGLFLDAYISKTTKNRFGICLASKELINQLHILLLNFGIISNMFKKYNKTYLKYYYEIQVAGENFHGLTKIINFDERHKRYRARKFISNHYNIGFNNVVPHIGAKVRKFVLLSGKKTYLKNHNIKVGRLKKVLAYFKNKKNVKEYEELKSLVEHNFFYDRVISKEHGKANVFDFYVPSNNRFFANGFINHNTVTLPNVASVEDVKSTYMLAYELGCKGISIYRFGSRDDQVFFLKAVKEQQINLTNWLKHSR